MEPYVKDGIFYRMIQTKDEVVSLMKLLTDVYFVDFPTIRRKQHIAPSFYKDLHKSAQNALENSIIVGVFDHETGEMAGGVIIQDRFGGIEGADPYEEYEPFFYPTIYIASKALQELIEDGILIKEKGKYLRLYLIAVNPSFRGRGIARELTKIHEEIAKERKYEYSYIHLFSKEYQNLCLGKGGYTEIINVPLLDFEIDGKKVFEDIQPYLKPGEEDIALKIALKKIK